MKFEWDPVKAASNLRKHGVSFELATKVFEDELSASFPDPDHSISEARWITFGVAPDGRVLVVAHTEYGDIIRIISARVATKKERKHYENH